MRTVSCHGFRSDSARNGFTLVELLTVIAIIALLATLFAPALGRAKRAAHQIRCLSNQRQIGLSAQLYMADHEGGLFRHHEGWVLDDGTSVDELPARLEDVAGGGVGSSHAEKPWVIHLLPYLRDRQAAFCPTDRTPRSRFLATGLREFNGGIVSADEAPPAGSELARARAGHLTTQSYLINSVFTHRSARYALEGVLPGFATESVVAALPNPNLILFSERNSEALNASDNDAYGNVGQDDYDTWVGERALVRWGGRVYGNEGWIRNGRHGRTANYIFTDGHAEALSWRRARAAQFPDHVVRGAVSPIVD